jgi:hypothetical protein
MHGHAIAAACKGKVDLKFRELVGVECPAGRGCIPRDAVDRINVWNKWLSFEFAKIGFEKPLVYSIIHGVVRLRPFTGKSTNT